MAENLQDPSELKQDERHLKYISQYASKKASISLVLTLCMASMRPSGRFSLLFLNHLRTRGPVDTVSFPPAKVEDQIEQPYTTAGTIDADRAHIAKGGHRADAVSRRHVRRGRGYGF